MIKINLEGANLTLVECLNFAMDISTWNRALPVMFSFQGIEFVIKAVTESGMAPRIKHYGCIADFDDEVLINEYFRRIHTSRDFRNTVEPIVNRKLSSVISDLFADAESRN